MLLLSRDSPAEAADSVANAVTIPVNVDPALPKQTRSADFLLERMRLEPGPPCNSNVRRLPYPSASISTNDSTPVITDGCQPAGQRSRGVVAVPYPVAHRRNAGSPTAASTSDHSASAGRVPVVSRRGDG